MYSASSATVETEHMYDFISKIFKSRILIICMIILIVILILSAFGKKPSQEASGEIKSSHGSGFLTTIIILFFLFLI